MVAKLISENFAAWRSMMGIAPMEHLGFEYPIILCGITIFPLTMMEVATNGMMQDLQLTQVMPSHSQIMLMKLFNLCWLVMLLTSVVMAQGSASYGVASMSPDELNRRLENTIKEAFGPQVMSQILKEALSSKRIDLIQVCFANLRTTQETVQAIVEMPDGELKQRATIMMLRTPNNFVWPPDTPPLNTDIIRPPVMSEPFISVIPQLLPQINLNENWLKYSVGRTKLADDMEAALNARGAKMPTAGQAAGVASSGGAAAAQSSLSLEGGATGVNSSVTTAQVPTPASESRASSSPGPPIVPKEESLPRHYLWITGGVLALFVLVWLALKKTR